MLAFPAFSDPGCSGELSLADDGAISDWTICSRGFPLQIVDSNEGQFKIKFVAQGLPQSVDKQWRRSRSSDDAVEVFQSADTDRSIEIRRTFRSSADDAMLQAISITNMTAETVMNFELGLELSDSAMGQKSGLRSLADYVYGYHRIDVALDDGNWQHPTPGRQMRLLAITSRHASLILRSDDLMEIDSTQEFTEESPSPFKPDDWQVVLDKGALGPGEVRTYRFEITALPTMTKTMAQAGHNNLIYADLWAPLGALCRWVEALLSWLSSLVGNLGLAMLLFAIATRFVTLPASIWASRRQQEYKMRFERAKPQMDKARRDFKGAERSERILAIYKDNRITPFSGLKGSVGLLVQIPFLLAIFNVTTRSSIFAHEEFLWISDLALPDAAMALPFVIPILGGHVNVLPLALGVFNILSSVRDQDTSHTSKVIPIIISLLIVTVFYSFSAALVLYWLTVNLLQAGERITLQRSKTST
jgi:YidC/Oxa1 family membrane protein insertase